MSINPERYPEILFEFSGFGLTGDEIIAKIDEMAQEYRFNDADEVYVEVNFRNANNNKATQKFFRYDRAVLIEFAYAYDHPEEVWHQSNLISLGSDVQLQLFSNEREGPKTFHVEKIRLRGPAGIYDELMARIRPEEEEESQTRYWFRRRRKGGFFPYFLALNALTSEEDEAVFLREELKRVRQGKPTLDWVNEYQLLIFSTEEEIKELLKEMEENTKGDKEEFAIMNECFSTPCIMWALKPFLTQEEYQELWESQSIFGTKARINEITKFLKKHEYNYTFQKEDTYNKTSYRNKEWTKEIKIQYVDSHWMRPGYITMQIHGHPQRVKLNCFLHKCIEKKLLRPMSAYELSIMYNNYSYAAYGFLNKGIDAAYEQIPENQIVPAPLSWYKSIREKPFNPNKDFPKIVIFFDFEADTSGDFHKPFLVSACEVRLKEDGSYLSIGKIQSFWGEDCAKCFMAWAVSRLSVPAPQKATTLRMYAYNARYDLTFILPYLKKTNACMRANKFYSIEGQYYKDFQKKPYKIEIWDAYLLFAEPLRKVAKSTAEKGYLKPEQAKDIKKEMFPYNAYTYEYFKNHSNPWVNVKDMKVGFMEQNNEGKEVFNETKYQEFLETVRKLPELYKREEGYCCQRAFCYGPCQHGYYVDEMFNYKDYAIFYCEQDVRCLTQIMLNMEDICMGRDTEGIQGQVPFKIHIWNHRTASSIGYDNLLMNAVYQYDENTEKWVPRHEFYFLQNEGRALMQKSIRGGRVMTAQNKVWYFKAENEDYLQDCDACSLYPSTMAKILWMTDGIPYMLKGDYTENDFQNRFTHPWAAIEEGEEKLFNDGIVHITTLITKKKLDIPRLCVKDPKTKLNEWRNFDGEPLDTWVNAKDLWDLIDHQDAIFTWDKAFGFVGKRHFELRECMRNLYAFRMPNKKLGVGNVAKLMMNSSYGKSTMKICDEEVKIIDANEFPKYFKANSYRIKSFESLDGGLIENKYLVKIYKKDTTDSFNMFGSDVLAGSKCLMQRFTSIVEDLAEQKGISPHIYYTDTDSNHILTSLVNEAQAEYIKRYHEDPMGEDIGQFHNDFDNPSTFKKDEHVKGAEESYFLAKKVYCDRLVGDQGSVGHHMRMKGIPGTIIKPEDYKELYEGKILHYNLLAGGKVSFAYENGHVVSRQAMSRDIGIKRARTKVDNNSDSDSESEGPTAKLPRTDAYAGSPQY